MNILQIYKTYPTRDACLKHLEEVRWNGKPECPYCKSLRVTASSNKNRFHCNNCNTSFSVTVQTIFHKTKVDLRLWFMAIALVINAKKDISARQLARDLGVNKNTAWSMLVRIRQAMGDDADLLQGIVEANETHIGSKNRNRYFDNKSVHRQEGSTKGKTPVFGLVIERSVA